MEKQPSRAEDFLFRVQQIIEENLANENFSIEDLAQQAGLSRSMLHRKLISLAGVSATDLITRIRLEKAYDLLKADAATASEIAYIVGFSDPSYFSKVFKKKYGVPPGQVKKNLEADAAAISGKEKGVSGKQSILSYRRFIIWLFLSLVIGLAVILLLKERFTEERSIAVLPLHNLTGIDENSYFVDGIHDALIGELGRVESLRVISRTSTLRYRDSDMLLEDIARDLGVNTIVEGSVSGVGDSLKLLIQLIKVFPKERHILVNEYRDNMENALMIQRQAVKDIARNIDLRLTTEEEKQLSESRPVNPETYKDYLQGMYYLNQGTPESFEQGIKYMQKAIKRDPVDPLAYAGLALGYAIRGHGMISPEGSFRSAVAAAERAVRLDPTLDEAYTALALIYSYQDWDWPKVQQAFENALKNNPSNAIAHAHYAFYWVHFDAREKALYHAHEAIMLEPHSASYHAWLAWLYHYYGENEEAEKYALRALELKEDIPYGNLVLGWVYVKRKEFEKAREVHEKLPAYGDYYKMLLGYTCIMSGDREIAMTLYEEMESDAKTKFVNPFHRGMLAGMLGYTERAFELFNEACDKEYYPIIYIDIFPGIEELKRDARYCDLMGKLKLPCQHTLIASQK